MAKIVQFDNDKYGIEVGFWNKRYLDIKHYGSSWKRGNKYFPHCQGDLEEVKEVYSRRYAKVKRVIHSN